ncbi:DUF5708 family protein [Nocardia sp. NPDC050712]|uniref:DUF5708 family protein n=1 Tax=Nocardia sp. NPDC050712 TaxID=3155518 RepID=UPI0033C83466
MRNHVISILIGVALLAIGLALWLFARDIETPVISLHKIGVVVAIIGGLDVASSVFAMVKRRYWNPDTSSRSA